MSFVFTKTESMADTDDISARHKAEKKDLLGMISPLYFILL